MRCESWKCTEKINILLLCSPTIWWDKSPKIGRINTSRKRAIANSVSFILHASKPEINILKLISDAHNKDEDEKKTEQKRMKVRRQSMSHKRQLLPIDNIKNTRPILSLREMQTVHFPAWNRTKKFQTDIHWFRSEWRRKKKASSTL